MSQARPVSAPRGTELTCKSWQTEAVYRMLQNNLDPEVAERPDDLVVYGGRGQAARSWEAFDAILASLKELEDDETLLVQSGKPVVVFKSHADAPRVLIANSNLVPYWATQQHFDELAAKGLIMYGQMTAGSWIYIGTQGILQGTYETLGSLAQLKGWGSLKGKWTLTAGLGGMGGAQPLAITMNEGRGAGGGSRPRTRSTSTGNWLCRCGGGRTGRSYDAGGRSGGERRSQIDWADRQRRRGLPRAG